MKFGDLRILMYLVWLSPVVLVFYIWAEIKRKRIMLRFAEKELLKKIDPFYSPHLAKIRIFLVILVLSLFMFALARPQWGFFWKENRFKGLDIIIALDTSKSMLARDVPPDRLSFAKSRIRDFVRNLKGDRVGLIAFAGRAFLQCPLTVDHGGFMLILNNISVNTIPRGGTSIAEAITEAARSYKGAETSDRILILITDGENTEGDLEKAIKEAREERIVVNCIGIGSKQGEPLRVLDEKGRSMFLKDKDGKVVKSSLDEVTLENIAEETGGMYVRATRDVFGLKKIYEEQLSGLERYQTKDRMVKVYNERFQIFLGIALICLIIGIFLL